ncbi:2-oxo-4-hydroxy-4-carboxy-5-ureidoimidazoline decarboxylase [uncultured Friedmanniella sp.]|uniref:2-oxo-4-hydroxy-4-carboxy-5-ureidoimidazoline decarboxylase n=1 Tax=uncultured Friedmanniella sp. TaxID=335381 RepID=UPI0035CC51DD
MTVPRVELTDDELREGLTACLAVPRWVDEVVAAAPFASLLALTDAAAAAANPLTPEEVDQALSHHPRIGERPVGTGTAPAFSRAEQAASASTDTDLAEALAAGNRAYEERFGRVFLIRAAGRSRPEILAELQRRLELDDETEIAIVASELRDIALRRIPQLFGHLDHHSGYNDVEAAE